MPVKMAQHLHYWNQRRDQGSFESSNQFSQSVRSQILKGGIANRGECMKVSMKLITAAAVLGAISILAPFPTWAEEAAAAEEETSAFVFGGYLTGASDYIFRGISQTRGDPAARLA
jgi:hypothetical protein